jgi:chromosome segregation protein
VGDRRQLVLQLLGEMAVAEQRQRNALAPRQRAEEEKREGEEHGVRLHEDRAQAVAERERFERELADATRELEARNEAEEVARRAVTAARAAVEDAERQARELGDRARLSELDRERAQRELDEVAQRVERLDAERATLGDTADLVRRELAEASDALETAEQLVSLTGEELAAARGRAREAREREAAARAELFRVDEAQTSLQGKVNALEALERERVGLAPAAARLLRDRAQFGDGAVLGPLSDFINANQASALVVERFLGATVHAILVRDAGVTDAIRRWHASANPGPLLLLPLDSIPDDAPFDDAASTLAELVDAAAPARGWVRALLGHVQAVDGGAAFVDARGAVWLPGSVAGPGPLRRRAELSALREELSAVAAQRQRASAEADALRAALEATEQTATAAAETAAEAQGAARRAA